MALPPLRLDATVRLFFDRDTVIKAMDDGTRKAMVKQLAFIRTRARSTQVLRRRKKSSAEGQSPSVHARGHASLKTILFHYDKSTKSGVVGPVKLNRKRFGYRQTRTTIPGTLEFGGSYKKHEEKVRMFDGRVYWRRVRRSRRSRFNYEKRWRRVTIKPRPFMSKALDIEIESGHIMDPWANVIGAEGAVRLQ